jgi:hypothetical protein
VGDEFQFMVDLSNTTARSMSSGFSNFFFDAAKGQLKDFQSYFNSIWDAILRKFTDRMSNMLVKYLMDLDVMKSATNSSGLGGILGWLGGFFGTGGGGGGEEVIIGGWHRGGIIGETNPSFHRSVPPYVFAGAPRLHSGLRGDEFPAILQKGEAVIPKDKVGSGGGNTNITIVALDSQSFHEYCKRNPQAIMGVVNQHVSDRKVQDLWRPLLR